MNKQILAIFCVAVTAFAAGYLAQIQQNERVIETREDFLDYLDEFETEIKLSNVQIYHHDFKSLLILDDSFTLVPISMVSPNSYPINDLWDYDQWKMNFFEDRSTDNQTRFIHVKINPNEQGFLLLQKGEWEYNTLNKPIMLDDP